MIFRVNLELFTAGDIMSHPVVTLKTHEKVQEVARLLVDMIHGGFPVVSKGDDGQDYFYGMITRYVILFGSLLYFINLSYVL